MIDVISYHAIDRLKERRGGTHITRIENKIKKWGKDVPDTCIVRRDGWCYVIKDKTLLTVYIDKKRKRGLREKYFEIEQYN